MKNITGSVYSHYGGYGGVQLPGANLASSYYYFPADPRAIHVGLTYSF